jgi:NAD(P)H-dependent FMN reductase
MLKIQIILGSTREGRFGIKVANWVLEQAKKRSDFEVELIDLKDWPMPFFNDPKLPSSGEYSYDYTKKWSEKISQAAGFLIITPEYNHGYPAVLKNALDLLYREWNKKAVGFISYGGAVGGSRAIKQLRQVVVELQMVSTSEALYLIKVREQFDEAGNIKDLSLNDRLGKLFDQLVWWTRAARLEAP